MLEIVIITIFIIACFAGIAWYAVKRSQQRNRKFLAELHSRMEPDIIQGDHAFGAVFEQELSQQILDTSVSDIDDEPAVILSPQARQEANSAQSVAQQHEIDLTIEDVVEIRASKEADQLQSQPQKSIITTVKDWDMVIAFTIMAAEGRKLSGMDLKAVLDSLGFHYGDMQIYHRLTIGAHKKPLFSVANIIEPGIFTPNDSSSMTTPGVLMFAKLPGPVNGLTLFDDLVETAQLLAEKLDGVLCDESRKPVNQATLESMRSRILTLNLTLQAEQNQNSDGYSN